MVDSNKFLDMAKDIIENEGLIDVETGKFMPFGNNKLALSKQIDVDKKEFIAVMIYKGTREEIRRMYHDH